MLLNFSPRSATKRNLLLCLMPVLMPVLMLSTAACSQQSVSDHSSLTAKSTKQPTLSANSGYQLQMLKDCEFVIQRQLQADEIMLFKKLKDAETHMAVLQAPLDLMEQQLASKTKLMADMSSQIEQQAQLLSEPDPVLLETQAELSQQISAIVDSFQPDIDAISSHGKQIGDLADQFTQLITQGAASNSYDQIRIIEPGESATKNCQQGMFFQKSFSVTSLKKL